MLKTYDAFNRLATETDARGNVKTHAYEHARGLHLGTSYTVVEGIAETSARSFTYNHLGQMIQLVDDAGTRSFAYNTYGEREGDSLVVDGDTHLITETRDSFGRSTGFVYAKNGAMQHTVTTGYGTDGRIASAGFTHGGASKNFGYEYLSGSSLLHKLTMPCNMSLTQTYESTRDLLTGMDYHRGTTLIAQRTYSYDILGRPTARNTARQGSVVNDTFAHNTRSELVKATVSGKDYEYAYDNIGNREFSLEDGKATMYDANALNQYTSIAVNGAEAFVPQFDADGNQTLIKTATGIWSAVYNAENRPVTFSNSESNTVVECQYDSQGRRAYKKVTVNGSVTLHQRYIYRGYLQIACNDLTRSNHPALWFITWDPTQPVATRPLAIRKDGTWYAYGWDLTKNICEVFGPAGYIRTAYTYSPYGQVTASGDVTQPIQWSSEYSDEETGLTYYNWRYYNPLLTWIGRDNYISDDKENKYGMCHNNPTSSYDLLGMKPRKQKKEDRQIARGRQATGKMLNKEKGRQSNINKLANQNTNVYSHNTLAPGIANGLSNLLDTYIFFATVQSTASVYKVINNIEKLCKDAKNENYGQNTGNGCCVARFVINKCYYNNTYVRILAKNGVSINYYPQPCGQVCFADPYTSTQEIKYVKIPMVGNTLYLN